MATKISKAMPPSRSRRSKSEVQQEFETIRRGTEAAREPTNVKSVEAEQRHSAEIRDAVEEISVDSVTQQISILGGQISKRQVQDIALKAIEGASGSRALAHVNQIAMEQAKVRPQG